MVSVFASFLLVNDPTVKMIGLGLAVAVLVDASLIRMVLVPSTMALLGDTNWWLPHWLDRVLPHLDIEGSTVEPVAETPRPHRPAHPHHEGDHEPRPLHVKR
jgi:RND superfamily putative drug exporter